MREIERECFFFFKTKRVAEYRERWREIGRGGDDP